MKNITHKVKIDKFIPMNISERFPDGYRKIIVENVLRVTFDEGVAHCECSEVIIKRYG